MPASEDVLVVSNSIQLLYIGSATVTWTAATAPTRGTAAAIMKPLLTILLFCFLSPANSQQVLEHSLFDCKKRNCDKKHKKIIAQYDSLSGLRIITTKRSSGLNANQFGETTPKKVKSFQEVITSNGKRLKACRSVTKFRGDVETASGCYISFGKQQPGFYVYHAPKLIRAEFTERYDATGKLIEKK